MPKKRTQSLSTDRQTNLLRQMGRLSEQLFQLDPISYSDPAEAMILTLANAMCAQYEKHRDEYEVWRTRLNSLLAVIDFAAVMMPNDDYLRAALAENAHIKKQDAEKELAGIWYKLRIIAGEAGYDIALEQPEITEAVNDRLKALAAFLHDDKHDSTDLREIAQKAVNVENLKLPNRGGRPEGMAEWKIAIRERWLDYEVDHQEATPADVRDALLTQVAERHPRQLFFTLKAGASDLEKIIYEKLMQSTAQRRPDQFRANLFK